MYKILIVLINLYVFIIFSCGLIIPNTMNVSVKNNYISSSNKYSYDVKVNYGVDIASLKYGEEEQFVVNWWGLENKELVFETKLTSINDVAQSNSFITHKVKDIKNFQKVSITLSANGSNDNLFNLHIE